MSNTEVVRTRLRLLPPPSTNESPWVAPFEQLMGAGYALFMAERYGIWNRNLLQYHSRVRVHAFTLVEDYLAKGETASEFTTWVSGFYFNSAIQRIVWASERLLVTFAGIPCRCGRASDIPPTHEGNYPTFRMVREGAMDRYKHVCEQGEAKLDLFKLMIDQLSTRYTREEDLNEDRILAMLQYDVNNRKHSLYLPRIAKDRKSAGRGDQKTWSTSGADVQMKLACKAFDLVGSAYSQLVAWNPSALGS